MKYDYHHVAPEHDDIHKRLVNWAIWADPRQRSMITPMFRLFRSKARQWHSPELKPALDTLDAIKIEQAVRALPMDQCEAIRWCYVRRTTPARQIRAIGCTYEGLYHLIQAGRGNLAKKALTNTKHAIESRALAGEYA